MLPFGNLLEILDAVLLALGKQFITVFPVILPRSFLNVLLVPKVVHSLRQLLVIQLTNILHCSWCSIYSFMRSW